MEVNIDERVWSHESASHVAPLTVFQELRQIEQELDVEILPGTEIMTDVGTHHFVKGAKSVLVPQPSSDPHDPLVSRVYHWSGSAC